MYCQDRPARSVLARRNSPLLRCWQASPRAQRRGALPGQLRPSGPNRTGLTVGLDASSRVLQVTTGQSLRARES